MSGVTFTSTYRPAFGLPAGEASGSAFDAAVLATATAPYFWWDFQDASFASAIAPHASALSQRSLAIVSGHKAITATTAFRSGASQAALIYGGSSGSWATEASDYSFWGGHLETPLWDATRFCMQFTFRGTTSPTTVEQRLFGATWPSGSQVGPLNSYLRAGGWDDIFIKGNQDTGPSPVMDTGVDVLDGTPHIITLVGDYTNGAYYRGYFDGVLQDDGTWAGSGFLKDDAWDFHINGRNSASFATVDWETDHCTIWGQDLAVPTGAEIIAMHDAFITERDG